MTLTINGKEREVKYTFNSFKYMEEFDISELQTLDIKPFKLPAILGIMLMGGLNHNPKVRVNPSEISEFLEKYAEDNSLTTLLEDLMVKLQESNFFKSLQEKE